MHPRPIRTRAHKRASSKLNRCEYLSGSHRADAGHLPEVAERGPREAVQSSRPLEDQIRETQRTCIA
jgi:hypothetical protein